MSSLLFSFLQEGINYVILITIAFCLPLSVKYVLYKNHDEQSHSLLLTLSLLITAYLYHKFNNLGWLALVIAILSGICTYFLTIYLIEETDEKKL